MYSIGKFSKLTGISTKTLIYYDNVGILKPEKVDIENGYRYYGEESFKKLANIHFWQEMGFSIKEITHLSKDIISNKIEQLHKKIGFITMNIDLLTKFKEENMENKEISIFEVSERLLQGKWSYQKSTENFSEAINYELGDYFDKSMPKFLFFGERHLGTDLKETFGYSYDCLSLKDTRPDSEYVDRSFWIIIVNHCQTLILYEKPDLNKKIQQPIMFHVYNRNTDILYTTKEINSLYEKSNKTAKVDSELKLQPEWIGKWKMYDEIKESDIEKYNGKVQTENACFWLSPLFDNIDIQGNGEVWTMEEGSDKIEIKGRNGVTVLNRENTKFSLCNSYDLDKFYIDNTRTGKLQECQYKKINGEDYLFVNLDNIPDINETIYVYKRQK